MTEVLLFHHIQGLTDGVVAFADELRAAGHVVHTPDLFAGRTFGSIEEGFAHAKELGDAVDAEADAAADALPEPLVYAGFSWGVGPAQRLAQTRAGARGALLFESCFPIAGQYAFGAWPDGVPVQVHGKEGDEFFLVDLDAARALADSTDQAELFLYPGTEHLFADSSLAQYDPAAAAQLTGCALEFLSAIDAQEE
jgi:dienelactone hydrolase